MMRILLTLPKRTTITRDNIQEILWVIENIKIMASYIF